MKRIAGIEGIKIQKIKTINKMNFRKVYRQIPKINAIFKRTTEHHKMAQDIQKIQLSN